jgi:hypothetical protein
MPGTERVQRPSGKGKNEKSEDEGLITPPTISTSNVLVSEIDAALLATQHLLTPQQKRDCGCMSHSEYNEWEKKLGI